MYKLAGEIKKGDHLRRFVFESNSPVPTGWHYLEVTDIHPAPKDMRPLIVIRCTDEVGRFYHPTERVEVEV
jgi:hypothetical protein